MNYLKAILTAILCFLLPIKGLLISVIVIIILDMFTGVCKSIKLGGWKSIDFEKLVHSITKFMVYSFILLGIYTVDILLLEEFTKIWFSIPFLVTKLVAMILCLYELRSIKHNVEAIFSINLYDFLKNIFQTSKEFKNDIKDLTQ